MGSRYDDELWELLPDEPLEPPEHLRDFVRSLGRSDHALDLGCGTGRLLVPLVQTGLDLDGCDVSLDMLALC